MSVTVFFIRHGETIWNQERRIQGMKGNSPLTELGKKQASQTASFLTKYSFSALYCSPLLRAVETAQTIAHPHQISPLQFPDLAEMNYGEWEGKTREEITIPFPKEIWDEQGFQFTCPGGESYFQAHQRFSQMVSEILNRHQPNETIGIITHGMVLLLYFSRLLGGYKNPAITIDNCSIHRIVFSPESRQLRLITLNQIHHLDHL